MRLKKHEIKLHRNKLLKKQKGVCPLCKTVIAEDEATLDHDHTTGHIRRVLHRSCNQVEGRVLSWIKRSRVPQGKELQFLKNLAKYWSVSYTDSPTHPTHLTDQEKELQKLRKKLRRTKRKSTRKKIQEQIKELQNG